MSSPPTSAPDRPEDLGRRAGPRLFAGNRRDGARLLSSGLIITVIGLVGWVHPLGRAIALVAGTVCVYWWLQYRQLSR